MEFKNGDPGADQLPAIIDKLGRAFEEFKSKVETEQREIKAGIKAAPVDLTKVEETLNNLQEAKAAIEARLDAEQKFRVEIEKKLGRPGMGHNGGPSIEDEVKGFRLGLRPGQSIEADGYEAYKGAFGAFLRKNAQVLGAEEVKALSVGSDADGGYLVPADMSGRIVTRVFETSPIRQIASVQSISTDALEGVRDTDEAASGGWVSETGTRAATGTPQVGKWRIPVHEMFAMPEATQQMLDDAAVDIEAWLGRKVADRLTRVENAAFVVGDGVGKPRGLAAYPTAATGDGTRPWGTLEHINTGADGGFLGTTSATASPANVLYDLVGAFKDAYLQNARWVTRREVITAIRKFKLTDGQFIWQPGLILGQPQTILGYPVTIAQDMPALGTASLSMAFGNFAEGYQIVDRQGFRVLRDPFTNKPFVRFYTTRRVGGGVIQFEAIKFLRFAAT
jgi:HK97 family phage major capsid protein